MKSGAHFALVVLLLLIRIAAAARQPGCNDSGSAPELTVATPGHPFSVIPSIDGCWLFVSLTSSGPASQNGIAIFERRAGNVRFRRVLPLDSPAKGMALSPDGSLLVVAAMDHVFFVDARRLIQGTPNPLLARVQDGEKAGSFNTVVTSDGKYGFVADEFLGSVTVLNLDAIRRGDVQSVIIGSIPADIDVTGLAFSPVGDRLYVTSQVARPEWNWPVVCSPEMGASAASPNSKSRPAGVLMVVDVTKARTEPAASVLARTAAGCTPARVAVGADGTVWVSARSDDAVLPFRAPLLISDPQHAAFPPIQVGRSPAELALISEGRCLAVANSNRFAQDQTEPSTVSVISNRARPEGPHPVVKTFTVGAFPRELTVSRDGRTLLISNYRSDSIQIIEISSLGCRP